ncbi:hypothetical protein BIW11_14285 [Tropilaelaps mercedesae]|uniref:Uncharacterized protein n=1 Tax=Tropilaelaps mercedesae TaxID=418985 RepID=A0A1V9WYD5_9ACAR|nr:hypothetical protein BIW11_14285 [Tropilaelaps mercedesae]
MPPDSATLRLTSTARARARRQGHFDDEGLVVVGGVASSTGPNRPRLVCPRPWLTASRSVSSTAAGVSKRVGACATPSAKAACSGTALKSLLERTTDDEVVACVECIVHRPHLSGLFAASEEVISRRLFCWLLSVIHRNEDAVKRHFDEHQNELSAVVGVSSRRYQATGQGSSTSAGVECRSSYARRERELTGTPRDAGAPAPSADQRCLMDTRGVSDCVVVFMCTSS